MNPDPRKLQSFEAFRREMILKAHAAKVIPEDLPCWEQGWAKSMVREPDVARRALTVNEKKKKNDTEKGKK